ncbi:unnamed protein product [marine sediment metagenome]|uniref:Uncharacterized protein n=1 Tax=marine sediment metagenome TaxID=412755 RepID=X0SY47_9ZZZZ
MRAFFPPVTKEMAEKLDFSQKGELPRSKLLSITMINLIYLIPYEGEHI